MSVFASDKSSVEGNTDPDVEIDVELEVVVEVESLKDRVCFLLGLLTNSLSNDKG